MFKILITTRYWSSSGCNVHTIVESFDTEHDALTAVRVINTCAKSGMDSSVNREAIALFEVRL
jgi:hypothetical protein